MNSGEQYEIIGPCKISYFIVEVCAWKLLKQCSTLAKLAKRKIEYFDLQQAFKISSLAQISSANHKTPFH